MPRTLPTGLQAELDKKLITQQVVHLLDLELGDGTRYYWADRQLVAPRRIPNDAAQQQYSGWIVPPLPEFEFSRSLRADYGELHVQNISGNTIDREVAALLKAREFEGALAIYRRWYTPLDAAGFEVHGRLTEQEAPRLAGEPIRFRMLQLMNFAGLTAHDFLQTRPCHYEFTSGMCGYRRGELFLGLTTADSFSANTIGKTGGGGLGLVVDLYKTQVVMILEGTGAGQERFIASHTADVFTVTANWTTNPDATSKFIVTGPGTMLVSATLADIHTTTTIGKTGSGWTTDQFQNRHVVILAGTGANQRRKITTNSSTTLTVSPAWTTTPDATSRFIVVYEDCEKTRAACDTRGVIERFPGLITLTPEITAVISPPSSGTGGGGGGGGTRDDQGKRPLDVL